NISPRNGTPSKDGVSRFFLLVRTVRLSCEYLKALGRSGGGQSMGDVWRSPRFRTGWKRFERTIRDKLEAMRRSGSESQEFEWDRWIQESLEALERHRASGYTWDVFETFRSVIVRISLPMGYEGRPPRIHVEERRLIVFGIPGKLDESIALPALVRPSKPQAVYANGVVEVRLRKKLTERNAKRVRCSHSHSKKSPSGR
ncbi:Hsp20/alpha crystallin family protein, partial [Paenibacillus sp. TRM 82003]|nr:Hsp20/alpha crystallin family protein [Paenibacillus sp. TRM 82003]